MFPAPCKAPGGEAKLPHSLFLCSFFPPNKRPGLAPHSGKLWGFNKGVVGAGVAPTYLKAFGALKPLPILQKFGGHKSSSVPRTACLCFPALSPSPVGQSIPPKLYLLGKKCLWELTAIPVPGREVCPCGWRRAGGSGCQGRGWFLSLLEALGQHLANPKEFGEGAKPPPAPERAVPALWWPHSPRDTQPSASALRQRAAAIGLKIIPERVLLWPQDSLGGWQCPPATVHGAF